MLMRFLLSLPIFCLDGALVDEPYRNRNQYVV